MNQVDQSINSKHEQCRPVQAAARLALLGVAIALLGACDPSPASRAVRNAPDSLDLAAVVPDPVIAEQQSASDAASDELPAPPEEAGDAARPDDAQLVTAAGTATENSSDAEGGLVLLGHSVAPGTSQRLMWSASEIFEGVSTETPVLVVNGKKSGPTLCLTAAIHGDELNGIEMVRRVLHDLDPKKLAGAVIGIPIVNLQGFRRGSRYLPDRRDLNRYFPGNPMGSSAARIANSLFEEIISKCNALVDLHTGSFFRTNLPQLRADLRYSKIKELTLGFGGMAVLHSVAAPGTLRRAATDAGIPSITLEAGEPLRLQAAKVAQGSNGIFKLLDTLDMVKRVQLLGKQEPVFYESTWIRADHGGILFTVVRLGQVVADGDVLGTVTDPITNEQNLIYSPNRGRVLGMALNQVVMPGFAAFRIGIETDGLPGDPQADPEAEPTEWGEMGNGLALDAARPGASEPELDSMSTAATSDTEEASE